MTSLLTNDLKSDSRLRSVDCSMVCRASCAQVTASVRHTCPRKWASFWVEGGATGSSSISFPVFAKFGMEVVETAVSQDRTLREEKRPLMEVSSSPGKSEHKGLIESPVIIESNFNGKFKPNSDVGSVFTNVGINPHFSAYHVRRLSPVVCAYLIFSQLQTNM